DDPLDNAQRPVVRPSCITLACAAHSGGNTSVGKARQLGRKERARVSDLGLLRVQACDLQYQPERGISKCGSASCPGAEALDSRGVAMSAMRARRYTPRRSSKFASAVRR